jgi:molybdopterin/thiamine biosynthesis adenylyltransferase
MDRQQWLNERDNRSLRYSNRRLDPNHWIAVTGESEYLRTYSGQAAAITACNLLSRMTPSVAVCLPDVEVISPLPWAGKSLREVVLSHMNAADPEGDFEARLVKESDYQIFLGRDAPYVVHGVEWDCYVGPGPSPLISNSVCNPFGAAYSAILAIARLFVYEFGQSDIPFLCNTFNWEEKRAPENSPFPVLENLGELWAIGAGSVGTAVLYFLTLATREFSVALFDHDHVKIHNLDRSPIFSSDDADHNRFKVKATKTYLHSVGVERVIYQPYPLHKSELWQTRQAGHPDIIVAAANEMNVRDFIEEGFPPIQLYATTGKNWQVALIRHIPLREPCSLCLFPNDTPAPETKCATAPSEKKDDKPTQIDAALPFLSFAAGLMTAAEITKLNIPGYAFCADRIYLHTRPMLMLVPVQSSHLDACVCRTRSANVHTAMIAESKYFFLSR